MVYPLALSNELEEETLDFDPENLKSFDRIGFVGYCGTFHTRSNTL